MSDDLVLFILENEVHFKNNEIILGIGWCDYKFEIALITHNYIRLKINFTYDEVFYNDKPLEEKIFNLIEGSGSVNDSKVLSRRAILRATQFKKETLKINDDEFEISNISQKNISIEKTFLFDDFDNAREGNLTYSVKQQLSDQMDVIDKKLDNKNKNIKFSSNEFELKEKALLKKENLKRFTFSVPISGRTYEFDIEGVGDQAIKIAKFIDFDDVWDNKDFILENKIINKLENSFYHTFNGFDDFRDVLNSNRSTSITYRIPFLIGDESVDFTLYVDLNFVKLEKYFKYWEFFPSDGLSENSLEYIIKNHIETFKSNPKVYYGESKQRNYRRLSE